jgi:hypothetical protein
MMKNRKWMAVSLTAAMAVSAYAQNLVENSSFESGISQWKSSSFKRGDSRVWLDPVLDKTNS